MTANLVQEAIRLAVHAGDSGVDRWTKAKRTNKPEFTQFYSGTTVDEAVVRACFHHRRERNDRQRALDT